MSRGVLGQVGAMAYVATVASLATAGFVGDSTTLILVAGAVTLPFSIPAMVAFYVAYGVLALVPGANPDESSGSSSCSPGGPCTGSSTGDLATWFAITADVLGVAALAAAAVANVLVCRWVLTRRRGGSPSQVHHGR